MIYFPRTWEVKVYEYPSPMVERWNEKWDLFPFYFPIIMMVDHNHGVLGKKKYRPQGACARVAVGQEKIKVGADHHIFIIFSLSRKSRQMASPAAQPTSRANWSSIFLAWGKLSTPKHQAVWMHTSQIKNPFALFLFIDHPMKALVLNGRYWRK